MTEGVTKLRVGGLNVRTLSIAGTYCDADRFTARLPEYLYAFRKQHLDMVVLLETRVPSKDTFVQGDYVCICSGLRELENEKSEKKRRKREDGVMIAVKKEWEDSITHIEKVSHCIMWIAGCFDGVSMAFLGHHAPTQAITDAEMRSTDGASLSIL